MNLFTIGELLGKTAAELLEMPVAEMQGWIAYSYLKNAKA